MKTDGEIRDYVIEELRWDPQITDPDAIGVAVKDGAVTLAGSVPTFAEKLAAARAAERVYGVKAAVLESGETVRGAAYTYQPNTQIDAVAGPRLRAAASHGLSHRRAATATASAGDRGPGPPRRRVPRIRAGRGG
jgi:hypothetical protein